VNENIAMLPDKAVTSCEGVTQVMSLDTKRIFDISMWFRLRQTSNTGFQLSDKAKNVYIYISILV
jgi:hypothetical protein